jgi:hypothetical protein
LLLVRFCLALSGRVRSRPDEEVSEPLLAWRACDPMVFMSVKLRCISKLLVSVAAYLVKTIEKALGKVPAWLSMSLRTSERFALLRCFGLLLSRAALPLVICSVLRLWVFSTEADISNAVDLRAIDRQIVSRMA